MEDEPNFSMGNPMASGNSRPKSSIPNSPTNSRKMDSLRKAPSNRSPPPSRSPSQQPPPPQRTNSSSPIRYNKIDEETKDTNVEIIVDEKPQKPRKTRGEKSMDVTDLNQIALESPSQSIERQKSQNVKRNNEKSTTKVENLKSLKTEDPPGRNFRGKNIIQYGLWAHYMSYGSSLMCITLGFFACLWTHAHTWGGGACTVNGTPINSIYIPDPTTGQCLATFNGHQICCDANSKSHLVGDLNIGIIYILYGLFLIPYENTSWGYGLWFPAGDSTFCYRNRISPIGLLDILVGIIGLSNYATCLAGACLLTNGGIYSYAAYRQEGGDGGRANNRKMKEQKLAARQKAIQDGTLPSFSDQVSSYFNEIIKWNPITFYKRIYNEDKLSSYFWVMIFLLGNFALFIATLFQWFGILTNVRQGLIHGTLDIFCNSRLCHANRKMVRYGPISIMAAWAKACGNCLNMDSSLILLPVIRNLLRKLNNSGESFSNARSQTDYFAKFFARPMTRYVPLQKNIEFHKMVAMSILFFGYFHMFFHFINLVTADIQTLTLFRFAKSDITDWLTGALVTYSMFIIYTAAPDAVRQAKYEIFFRSHHMFIVFFLMMFLHGPVYIFWSMLPVGLYILERLLQLRRGNRPYLVCKVEWIPPVMAIYFRPVFKEDFVFKEGQYLYLNCPNISLTEWHPFTISSAHDDLHNGPRIHLETGEEVVEVPRPPDLPKGAKWNKYCFASKDYTTIKNPNDYLDKSETGYMDYVSVHVKVHGLEEPKARTWTRKLKEYFELLSPGGRFPFYFYRRDQRGEILIGRQYGPDGKEPIIRVDGPHSAPSEHYTNYGTVMLVGAGIGLTPCASVLCALTKYRWKKNFNPEILHFYWIVRQSEVDSFQWLVHMLTDLSFEMKRGLENGQIEGRYYCEINIYVTGVEKTAKEVRPLYRPKKDNVNFGNVTPAFTADELYAQMLNPTVESKGQVKKMKNPDSPNRLQDIWIWNGRPYWDEIFREIKEQRQHSDIGVCFCGAPVIGADLKTMCEKYSKVEDDCLFTLHKENF